MKRTKLIIIAFIALIFTSCGPSAEEIARAQKAQAEATEKAEKAKQDSIMLDLAKQELKNRIQDESKGAILLKDLQKMNGVEKDLFGQKVYQFEYRLVIEMLSDVEKISGDKWLNANWYWGNFGVGRYYYDSYSNNLKTYPKGSNVEIEGILDLEKTDNGWRVSGHSKIKVLVIYKLNSRNNHNQNL